MEKRVGFGLGLTLLLAAPALADVKAGVDAWSRGDFPHAVAEWRGPAVAGDADAQFNLGKAYLLGRGVGIDPRQAREWFFKAASQGHELAQDEYGIALFQNGQKAEAAPWLEKAVRRDRPRAELLLGSMLFNGEGVGRDYPRAYALMTRASQQGLKSASETLVQMDGFIGADDKAKGLAMAQTYAIASGTGSRLPGERGAARHEVAAVEHHEAMKPHREPHVVAATEPTRVPDYVVPHRAPRPAAAPASRATDGWRVQLGAFRDASNASALARRVGGRLGAHVSQIRTGNVIRVVAGPYASRAEAQRACVAVGGGCVVIAP